MSNPPITQETRQATNFVLSFLEFPFIYIKNVTNPEHFAPPDHMQDIKRLFLGARYQLAIFIRDLLCI